MLVFATVSSPVRAQDSGVTATVGANVISLQAGPGLDFSSVGTVTIGTKLQVIARAHGSNRIWYEVQLDDGTTAWVSERVVNIDPSPDSLPWVGDNPGKTPLVMDCGRFRPLLWVGAYVQVTTKQALVLSKDAGLGKTKVGSLASQDIVEVLDGPFCTLLNMNTKRYQTQWLVMTKAGVKGYMLEAFPNSQQYYVKIIDGVDPTAFPKDNSPTATPAANANNTDRPSFVTDDDIQAVADIFAGVQAKKFSQTAATTQLQALVDANDPSMLPWIVRRVAIYDGKAQQWVSFARYDDMSIMVYNLGSDLDLDPVKTTVTILFGQYDSVEQEWASMGCGG